MAWKQVESYSFGFSTTDKKFWVYYTLRGSTSTTQLFLTASQFVALQSMFTSATGISYEDVQKYFTTAPRTL